MKRKAAVKVNAPRFQSEGEEARWWADHQDLVEDLLVKHGRRAVVPLKSVTVRLPVADIDKARRLADARGVRYQTLIKTLLHDAVKREDRTRATGKQDSRR